MLVVAFVLLASSSGVAPASEAQLQLAYLDPGTGSLIVQVLIAVFAGASLIVQVLISAFARRTLVVRKYWKRIQGALGLPSAEVGEEDMGRKPASDE